jgi:hypothetical protein
MKVEAETESVPRKSDMLIALPVTDGGQRVDRQLLWQMRQRGAEKNAVDERVGGQRKMLAMLLDSSRGQYQERRLLGQSLNLLPGEIREVAGVRNPALHEIDAPAAGLSKVTILPGFNSPLVS